MGRYVIMAVAVVCYFAFFASFLYLVGFLAGLPVLPTNVDKGIDAPLAQAMAVDIGLIALFGIQHSVMARPGFKQWWTGMVHPAMERSIYCLAAAVVLAVMFAFWHPIPGQLWSVTDPVGKGVLWALFLFGFATVFISTWLLNHFELFGLAQAWSHLRGTEMAPPRFRTPVFYRHVRHPIYLGFMLLLWATPQMTAGHLLFAAGMTLYTLLGVRYEERDLVVQFGTIYEEYRARVGMIIPGIGKR